MGAVTHIMEVEIADKTHAICPQLLLLFLHCAEMYLNLKWIPKHNHMFVFGYSVIDFQWSGSETIGFQ